MIVQSFAVPEDSVPAAETSGVAVLSISAARLKGISYDDETGHNIGTVELGAALKEAGGVDIYASDACLMQMAEVVYELRNGASFVVGSEEKEPGDGWSYNLFLSRLNRTSLTPESVATAAVESYAQFYKDKGKGVTISAVRTRDSERLRLLLDQWTELAVRTQRKAELKQASFQAMCFIAADARDLMHFLSLAAAAVPDPALGNKTAEILDLMRSQYILANATVGNEFRNSYGLSVYMPLPIFDTSYRNLSWAKDGRWDEFILWLKE